MKDNIEREGWADYLTQFNKRNTGRPTWLQVFGEAGAQSEEQGLPLVGISIEEKGADAPRVQIMLGGHDAIETRHLTHMISNVERLTPQVGTDGRDEALAIIDEGGEMSLLRFEPKPKATELGFRQPSCCQSALNVLSSITLPPPPTDQA